MPQEAQGPSRELAETSYTRPALVEPSRLRGRLEQRTDELDSPRPFCWFRPLHEDAVRDWADQPTCQREAFRSSKALDVDDMCTAEARKPQEWNGDPRARRDHHTRAEPANHAHREEGVPNEVSETAVRRVIREHHPMLGEKMSSVWSVERHPMPVGIGKGRRKVRELQEVSAARRDEKSHSVLCLCGSHPASGNTNVHSMFGPPEERTVNAADSVSSTPAGRARTTNEKGAQ